MPNQTTKDRIVVRLLDFWLQYGATHFDVPGFQVCIRKGEKVLLSKAYGYACLESRHKYTTSHWGHLASHSKMLTAALALVLQESGKLSLSDTAAQHLGWLKRHVDKRYQQITLRDLLTHRAGILGDGTDGSYWSLERAFPSAHELKAEILRSRLVYAPNTETKYSNFGYSLFALVLEKIFNKPYRVLVNDIILVKNKDLALTPDYDSDQEEKYASGYSKRFYEGERKAFRHVPTHALAAATGLCGNIESSTLLVKRLYLDGYMISEESRRELRNLNWPIKNATQELYGLGTAFHQTDCGLFCGHSGGFPGFTSQTRLWNQTDYVFGFVANTSASISMAAIKSFGRIFLKIEETFSENEMSSLLVSPPLMNWWGVGVYVLGKNKALYLPILDWSFGDESIVFFRRKDGFFETHKISGYGSVGEPVEFFVKDRKIKAVKRGAFLALPKKEFLEKSRLSFFEEKP
ncbi:MAG: beta-lactamase family protein [Alphaproteobacteria bacterium]|nr:beta-lactamase family protein [Alphaproteobacteria bacterium]